MFAPVFLLSQMPPVISPENNDGFTGVNTAIQRVEHPANLSIRKTNGGQVGLHCFSPLSMRDDVRMISIWLHCKVLLSGRIIDLSR